MNEIYVYMYSLKINVDNLDNDEQFNKLKKAMGITYQDNVVISPEKMPNYQERVSKKWVISQDVLEHLVRVCGYRIVKTIIRFLVKWSHSQVI